MQIFQIFSKITWISSPWFKLLICSISCDGSQQIFCEMKRVFHSAYKLWSHVSGTTCVQAKLSESFNNQLQRNLLPYAWKTIQNTEKFISHSSVICRKTPNYKHIEDFKILLSIVLISAIKCSASNCSTYDHWHLIRGL